MTRDEFGDWLWSQEPYTLDRLVLECRRSYVKAADLLGLQREYRQEVNSFRAQHSGQLRHLAPFWSALAELYEDRHFCGQAGLFRDHMEREVQRWEEYIGRLVPWLASSERFLRLILAALGLLGNNDRRSIATELAKRVRQDRLPQPLSPYQAEVQFVGN